MTNNVKKQKTIEFGEIYKCVFPKRYFINLQTNRQIDTLVVNSLIIPKDIYLDMHEFNVGLRTIMLECYNMTANKTIYVDANISYPMLEMPSKEKLIELSWQNFNIVFKKL